MNLSARFDESRNLVRFCRRPGHETLHADFTASFGFREMGSRMSILKDVGTAPGPDECFAHIEVDARRMFYKLLGLELEFPGAPEELLTQMQPYNSMNYYRSHIEEHFCLNGVRPLPPLRGLCTICFADTDRLQVSYELSNVGAAPLKVRLRWFSVPDRHFPCTFADGVLSSRQKVIGEYDIAVAFQAERRDLSFQDNGERLESAWIDVEIEPRGNWSTSFCIAFDDSTSLNVPPMPSEGATAILTAAKKRMDAVYAALPSIPLQFADYEELVLRAVGILIANEHTSRTLGGDSVRTIHAGKAGVCATWWWDTACSLLGMGLLRRNEAARGAMRLLLEGVDEQGVPCARYVNGKYFRGHQQPILAWGLERFHQLSPDPALVADSYEGLARYVRHWLRDCDSDGNGLVEYPPGAVCWDDSLRWQSNPVAFAADRAWYKNDWGKADSGAVENADTNANLYTECICMAKFAQMLDKREEARGWRREAARLRELISEQLFDPELQTFQDRRVGGAFTNMLTPSCFMPLYAEIPEPELALQICERYLLAPEHFNTLLPFPSLDLAHPAFRGGGFLKERGSSLSPQSYWIGRTWPHVSFWMVGAIYRSGLQREADEAADRILSALNRSESIYECYDPMTGYGVGHAEFSWSASAVLSLAYRLYREV